MPEWSAIQWVLEGGDTALLLVIATALWRIDRRVLVVETEIAAHRRCCEVGESDG